MSEITCPFCSATLFDSELAAGECTSCMQKLPRQAHKTWPGGSYGSHWGAAAHQPRPGAGDLTAGRGWQGVRGGVGVLALATWATVALFPLLALTVWAHDVAHLHSPGVDALAIFLLLGLMVSGLVALIGLVLSLTAPAWSGLRMHAVGSGVALLLSPLVIASPFVLVELTRQRIVRQFEWLLILMLLAGIVLELAAWAWYCVYLRGVARWFGDEPLGVGFLSLGIVAAVGTGMGLGILFLCKEVFHRHDRELEQVLLVGWAFGGLIVLVWLGVMLVRLYRLIPSDRRSGLPRNDD